MRFMVVSHCLIAVTGFEIPTVWREAIQTLLLAAEAGNYTHFSPSAQPQYVSGLHPPPEVITTL